MDLRDWYRRDVVRYSIRRFLHMGWSGLLGATVLHYIELRVGSEHPIRPKAQTGATTSTESLDIEIVKQTP